MRGPVGLDGEKGKIGPIGPPVSANTFIFYIVINVVMRYTRAHAHTHTCTGTAWFAWKTWRDGA